MHDHGGRRTPARPPRRWRRLYLAGLVGALALTLGVAACGGGTKTGRVASLGGADQPASTTSAGDERQKALHWASCMRQHGINMPDPQITGTGRNLNITQNGPTGVNKKDPRVKTAQQACQHYLARGPPGGSNALNPPQQQQLLAFARCMRQHGLPGFPDPRPDGGFVTQGDGKDSPAFTAAERACEHYLAGGKGSGR